MGRHPHPRQEAAVNKVKADATDMAFLVQALRWWNTTPSPSCRRQGHRSAPFLRMHKREREEEGRGETNCLAHSWCHAVVPRRFTYAVCRGSRHVRRLYCKGGSFHRTWLGRPLGRGGVPLGNPTSKASSKSDLPVRFAGRNSPQITHHKSPRPVSLAPGKCRLSAALHIHPEHRAIRFS